MSISRVVIAVLLMASCLLCLSLHVGADARDYFQITVVDAATGRGVPLVELETTNEMRFYTDSNGVIALDEPDLMGQNVYFSIKSHGYEYPADGFGYRGVALAVKRGGKAQIRIQRVNIAERLYRITGAGIYRDSVLVGQNVPIKQPLLNGQVMGQDTVEVTPYRGKLYWFWGDTERPSYPLGQFATSGATSLLPGHGGLDPSLGVDLTYWVDSTGFSRPMLPLPGLGGPVWIGGLFTLNDETGRERLLTHYVHLDHTGKVGEQGLALFNDAKAVFEPLRAFAVDAPLYPEGHPFRAMANGLTYLYFEPKTGAAMPLVRVQADLKHVTDLNAYEGFTCLAPGSHYEKEATRLDRDPAGRLIYRWKPNTPPLGTDEEKALIAAGKLKPEEALLQLRDIDTDAPIQTHGGSVFWNAYRRRWVMIAGQQFGTTSLLGELWFAEADTPVGPWVYAKKIVTHDRYTFYNPTQHPFFDQDGGRLIYFEGTYTDTYSGVTDITPRYNYNQIMYRLSLDDPRLSLPAPVYRLRGPGETPTYAMRETVDARNAWGQAQAIAFYAVPPDRPHAGLIPLGQPILCYALPPTPAATEKPSPALVPLYEYHDEPTGAHWFSTDPSGQTPTAKRSAQPVARVWRNPATVLALDAEAKAVP